MSKAVMCAKRYRKIIKLDQLLTDNRIYIKEKFESVLMYLLAGGDVNLYLYEDDYSEQQKDFFEKVRMLIQAQQ